MIEYEFDPAARGRESGNWLLSMVPLIAAAIVIVIGLIVVNVTCTIERSSSSRMAQPQPVAVERSAPAGSW
jgi:hypothetical protein